MESHNQNALYFQHDEWDIKVSDFGKNTFNPVRHIIQNFQLVPNPEKRMIAFSLGDPTTYGNMCTPPEVIDAMTAALQSMKYNGYAPSTGHVSARKAVAEFCSCPGATLNENDVVLTSGGSSALDMCMTALANPGQNFLVPRPGFPHYKTMAETLGISVKQYNLIPTQNWEVDLHHMESLIDENTVAIIVNNPSNPCGSVYSKEHLLEILSLAEHYKLPILADEIYGYFVFPGNAFHPLASLTDEVPVLSCGGLTKRFLVPGWRLGWILIHDRNGRLEKEVSPAIMRLTQRIMGPNTIVQGALPSILANTPQSFFRETIDKVKETADVAFKELSKIPGVNPIMPQGAMYMMVGFDMENFPEFQNDLQFLEALVSEQSVFGLPGQCFNYPNYMRIVLTVPPEAMKEAAERIHEFVLKHRTTPMAHKMCASL